MFRPAWILLVLLLLFSCRSREERIAETRTRCADVLGFWTMTFDDGSPHPPTALKWIDVDEDGDLMERLHVELQWNAFMRVDNEDIAFDDGMLQFYDEFSGRMDVGAEKVRLSYRTWDAREITFVLRRLDDPDTIRMMKEIYAERSASIMPLPVPDLRDGLAVASFAELGVDSIPLIELLGDIHDGNYGDLHSLLMMKNGRLFLEEYFGADGALHGPATAKFLRRQPVSPQSVSKSVLSALVGIAIDSGLIPDVNTPVAELFPEYAHFLEDRKLEMTLEHLLAMNSGLEWNGPSVAMTDTTNDTNRLQRHEDPLAFLFSRRLRHLPGKVFRYNNGHYHAVQELLDCRIPDGTGAFARRVLFDSIGCDSVRWGRQSAPHLRPRDMARFGMLYLRKGRWQGRQIIPAEWVTVSTVNHQQPGQTRYGYFWWPQKYITAGDTLSCITAIGSGGQYILLFPSIDFLLATTANNYDRRTRDLRATLEDVILPAVMHES